MKLFFILWILYFPNQSATSHLFLSWLPRYEKTTQPRPRMSRKRQKQPFRGLGEAKPATGFIEKRKKLRIPWTESSKNGENCEFRGRNRQKTAKTANSVDGIIKKRRKLQIPWAESSEIAENCKFRGQNHQKTEKTAFPNLGKVKNSQKLRFPTLGKIKNRQKQRFGHGRKIENSKNCVSATGER